VALPLQGPLQVQMSVIGTCKKNKDTDYIGH